MINLNSIIQFLVIFIVAFLGSVANDFYNTMSNKDENVEIVRVLLSALTGTFLVFATSNYLSLYIDNNLILLISFISGITGFKIFEQFKSVDLVCLFWKFVDVVIEDRELNETDLSDVDEVQEDNEKKGDDLEINNVENKDK